MLSLSPIASTFSLVKTVASPLPSPFFTSFMYQFLSSTWSKMPTSKKTKKYLNYIAKNTLGSLQVTRCIFSHLSLFSHPASVGEEGKKGIRKILQPRWSSPCGTQTMCFNEQCLLMTPCFNQSMRPQSDEGKYLAEAEVPDLPNWIRLSSPPWGFVIILKSEFQLFSFCPNMLGLFTKPCSQFQTPCFPLAREYL